jgi:hypothetical protein
MQIHAIIACGVLAGLVPCTVLVAILAHYCLLSICGRRREPGNKRAVIRIGILALGMAFQFMQVLYRPSVAYVLQAKRDEDADEDDSGGPESLTKQLHRQLRRIRRGEFVERLVLRL